MTMQLHVLFTDDGIPGWIGSHPREGSELVDNDLMFLAAHRRTAKGLWVKRGKEVVRQPTPEELEAEARSEQELASLARDEALRQALAAEADPLFFKWQRGEIGRLDWLAAVAEVKARHPKPGSDVG